jgi:hypothetical protein
MTYVRGFIQSKVAIVVQFPTLDLTTRRTVNILFAVKNTMRRRKHLSFLENHLDHMFVAVILCGFEWILV